MLNFPSDPSIAMHVFYFHGISSRLMTFISGNKEAEG
jgi:hypothetical protein